MSKSYSPRMHTAEHILNQAMVRQFGCGRCFSAHIEKKKSKCDYRFDRPLTDQETIGLVETVNAVIDRNLPVLEEFLSREEAEGLYQLGRLPEDAGDRIRIVKVGDFDACPCIGPHVASTGELGKFNIISTDFNEGVLRIRFKLQTLD